jgi:hypothetical protein
MNAALCLKHLILTLIWFVQAHASVSPLVNLLASLGCSDLHDKIHGTLLLDWAISDEWFGWELSEWFDWALSDEWFGWELSEWFDWALSDEWFGWALSDEWFGWELSDEWFGWALSDEWFGWALSDEWFGWALML